MSVAIKRVQSSISVAEMEKEKKELLSVKSSTSLADFEIEWPQINILLSQFEKEKENEKKKKKREIIAVFEFGAEYFIHNIDLVKVGAGDDDIRYFGQPILFPNFPNCPINMSIFSFRSKLYFCGGIVNDPPPPPPLEEPYYCHSNPLRYSCQAYMFDLASNRGTPIQSMNYPKPCPLIFGPDENHKFYVFSCSSPNRLLLYKPSMEIFDTCTNTWDSVDVPSYLDSVCFTQASFLCGSNIIFSTFRAPGSFLFCTISRSWTPLEISLPFEKSQYLFQMAPNCHLLLATPFYRHLPELYLFQFDSIKHLGEVEGLMPRSYDPWEEPQDIYYLDGGNSICVVSTKSPADFEFRHGAQFDIDVVNVSYHTDDFTSIKAKVENTLHFKYISKRSMMPRYCFVAG